MFIVSFRIQTGHVDDIRLVGYASGGVGDSRNGSVKGKDSGGLCKDVDR